MDAVDTTLTEIDRAAAAEGVAALLALSEAVRDYLVHPGLASELRMTAAALEVPVEPDATNPHLSAEYLARVDPRNQDAWRGLALLAEHLGVPAHLSPEELVGVVIDRLPGRLTMKDGDSNGPIQAAAAPAEEEAMARRLSGWQAGDGSFHRTKREALARQARLAIEKWVGLVGLGRGGEWGPEMIVEALLENAGPLGDLLLDYARKTSAIPGDAGDGGSPDA